MHITPSPSKTNRQWKTANLSLCIDIGPSSLIAESHQITVDPKSYPNNSIPWAVILYRSSILERCSICKWVWIGVSFSFFVWMSSQRKKHPISQANLFHFEAFFPIPNLKRPLVAQGCLLVGSLILVPSRAVFVPGSPKTMASQWTKSKPHNV